MSEQVNHPEHYNAGRIEVIEFIEDQGWGLAFCLGNATKYIARAGKKDASKIIEDLEKADWYLKRAIEGLKAARDGRLPVRPNDMNARVTVEPTPTPTNGRPIGGECAYCGDASCKYCKNEKPRPTSKMRPDGQ